MEGNGGLFATTIISTKLAKSSKSENSESKSMQLLTIKSITCKPKSEWYFLACVHGLKDVELHNIIAKCGNVLKELWTYKRKLHDKQVKKMGRNGFVLVLSSNVFFHHSTHHKLQRS